MPVVKLQEFNCLLMRHMHRGIICLEPSSPTDGSTFQVTKSDSRFRQGFNKTVGLNQDYV